MEQSLNWIPIFMDLSLASGLLFLAWFALNQTQSNPFRSIVLFMAFGLFMALTWIRLEAPDVALAEAAVGSGITGALYLSFWRESNDSSRQKSPSINSDTKTSF